MTIEYTLRCNNCGDAFDMNDPYIQEVALDEHICYECAENGRLFFCELIAEKWQSLDGVPYEEGLRIALRLWDKGEWPPAKFPYHKD